MNLCTWESNTEDCLRSYLPKTGQNEEQEDLQVKQ